VASIQQLVLTSISNLLFVEERENRVSVRISDDSQLLIGVRQLLTHQTFYFAQAANHFALHLGGFDLLNHFLDVAILSFQVFVHPPIVLPLLRKLLLLLLGGRSFTFDAEIA